MRFNGKGKVDSKGKTNFDMTASTVKNAIFGKPGIPSILDKEFAESEYQCNKRNGSKA
jgi:hypothetical protein